MTWVFILFWVVVGAFCIYIIIDIQQTKTNAEKITRIKEEMEHVDKMNDLTTRMARTRQQNVKEWTELYEYGIQFYKDIKTYLTQIIQTIIQFIVDIIRHRLYAFIG